MDAILSSVVGGGESDLGAPGYYNGSVVGIDGARNGTSNSLVTGTNVPSTFSVIEAHPNASYYGGIGGGGGTNGAEISFNGNSTLKEYVGVDNDSVFTYMYVISCSGYIVNASLFFTICCKQKFRRATNYLLANLCISSILFLMVTNLRLIERSHGPLWAYNEANCIVWSVFRRIPQALASLTIVAISCDRSQAARILVNRPCSSDMTKRILRIWLIAILTTLPRGLLYRYRPDLETAVVAYKCSAVAVGPYGMFNFLYAFFHLTSIFILPMCILIFDIYSTVQKIVFLKSRQLPLNQEDEGGSQNTQLHKKQLQLLRNSCLFAALFLICWLPWGIYQQLGDLPKSIVSPDFRYLIWIHFKIVRYLPFTVTAFLPLLLVVLTYDANMFGYWKKCLGGENRNLSTTAAGGGDNYRPNDRLGGDGLAAHRLHLPHNRPPVRLQVNNVHQEQLRQQQEEGGNANDEEDNENDV